MGDLTAMYSAVYIICREEIVMEERMEGGRVGGVGGNARMGLEGLLLSFLFLFLFLFLF